MTALRWIQALVWKEFHEEWQLYGAITLALLSLDLWVYLDPGFIRGILIPFLYVPVFTFMLFTSLSRSFQREWGERTLNFLFSLPVPRGVIIATKYAFHWVLFMTLFLFFSILAWKLMNHYGAYLSQFSVGGQDPTGQEFLRAQEELNRWYQQNTLCRYLKATVFFSGIGIFLFGGISLYTLLPQLVSRFRGLVSLTGLGIYAYLLIRFAPQIFPDPLNFWEVSLGLALYGLIWTVGVGSLYAWRAEA